MPEAFRARCMDLVQEQLPLPGHGDTAARHRGLFAYGREDLSVAKVAEAHFDALAILAEAGRAPAAGALYAVWASDLPGEPLMMAASSRDTWLLSGHKRFCSGAGLATHALTTTGGPDPLLLELDLRAHADCFSIDRSAWKASAFALTQTAAITFRELPVTAACIVCPPGEEPGGWYLRRPGFWHGACGPAACWAGGAAGLLDAALTYRRDDPHTLAHLGALHATVWGFTALLETAGAAIDADPANREAAHRCALALRHLVDAGCASAREHFTRAYGPHPLCMVEATARRIAELTMFTRQCHAERDLEVLGSSLRHGLLA